MSMMMVVLSLALAAPSPDHIKIQTRPRTGLVSLEEQVAAHEPRRVDAELEAHEDAFGNGEDVVEVLKTAALRLLDQQEDEHEGDQVQPCEEAQRAVRP